MTVLIVVLFTYKYWYLPAVLLFNWISARILDHWDDARKVVTLNLGLSLVFFTPLDVGGGWGPSQVPWTLGLSEPGDFDIPWGSLSALMLVSVVTSTLTVSRIFRKSV